MGCCSSKSVDSKASRVTRWHSTGIVALRDSKLKTFPDEVLDLERSVRTPDLTHNKLDTTKEFVAKLDLKPGQKGLDVGCGIGGGDFFMAENCDVHLVGIDLSINMISFALEHAIAYKK